MGFFAWILKLHQLFSALNWISNFLFLTVLPKWALQTTVFLVYFFNKFENRTSFWTIKYIANTILFNTISYSLSQILSFYYIVCGSDCIQGCRFCDETDMDSYPSTFFFFDTLKPSLLHLYAYHMPISIPSWVFFCISIFNILLLIISINPNGTMLISKVIPWWKRSLMLLLLMEKISPKSHSLCLVLRVLHYPILYQFFNLVFHHIDTMLKKRSAKKIVIFFKIYNIHTTGVSSIYLTVKFSLLNCLGLNSNFNIY